MRTPKLKYLIKLLDDNDQQVVHQVSEDMVQLGVAIIPELEELQQTITNDFVQEQIEKIIEQIQFNQLLNYFKQWVKYSDNLLDGLMLIATYQYPDLNKEWIQKKINNIYINVNFEVSRYQSPQENTKIINKYFYKTFNFSTVFPPKLSPQHFFINHLLSHQKTHPTVLTILYVLIAKKLNLPIHAFELDEDLLLVWGDVKQAKQKHKEDSLQHYVSFFINPYKKGAIISKTVMRKHIQKTKNKRTIDFNWLEVCSNHRLLTILALHLQSVYWEHQIKLSVTHFDQIIAVLERKS